MPTGSSIFRNNTTVIGAGTAGLKTGTLYRIGLHEKVLTGGRVQLDAYLADGATAFGTAFASTTTATISTTAGAGAIRVGFNDRHRSRRLDRRSVGRSPVHASGEVGQCSRRQFASSERLRRHGSVFTNRRRRPTVGREAENEVGRDAGRMADSIQMNGIEEARPKFGSRLDGQPY